MRKQVLVPVVYSCINFESMLQFLETLDLKLQKKTKKCSSYFYLLQFSITVQQILCILFQQCSLVGYSL